MSISADVLDAIRGMSETFNKGTADQSGGGAQRWPDEGPCNAWLRDFSVEKESFRYEQQEVPGIAYKFTFETMDEADNFTFNGAPFRFPLNVDELKGSLPNNIRARIEIETNRLVGHFTALLGNRPDDIAAGAVALMKKVERAKADDNPIAVMLQISSQTRKYGQPNNPIVRTYHKEYVTGLISVEDD